MYRTVRDRKNTAFFFKCFWHELKCFFILSKRIQTCCLRSLMSSPYKALVKFFYVFRNMQAFKYRKSTAPFQPWHFHVMKKADNRLTFISWSLSIIQPIFLNRLQDRAKLSVLGHQWSSLPSVPTHVKHSCKQRTNADKQLAYTCLLLLCRSPFLCSHP